MSKEHCHNCKNFEPTLFSEYWGKCNDETKVITDRDGNIASEGPSVHAFYTCPNFKNAIDD